MLNIMSERERTKSMGMRSIAKYIYTFGKFQENTTILSYIHVFNER